MTRNGMRTDWVLCDHREASDLLSQCLLWTGGVIAVSFPSSSGSLGQWLVTYFVLSWTSSLAVSSDRHCDFSIVVLPFYYLSVYLDSVWFLGEIRTAVCIVSMSFCSIVHSGFLSILVLVYLAQNHCFIWSLLAVCLTFWARNYFFFLPWGKCGKQFR